MANGVLVSHVTTRRQDDLDLARDATRWRPTSPPRRSARFDLTISTRRAASRPTSRSIRTLGSAARCSRSSPAIVDFFSVDLRAAIRSTRSARSSTTRPTSATRSRRRRSRSSTACRTSRTLVHELSHMWFGDSVTLYQWPDIWLHEGFATWSEWIWSEHAGGAIGPRVLRRALQHAARRRAEFWTPPPDRAPRRSEVVRRDDLPARGGMTLQALREKVGDFAFFRIMRGWADAQPLRQREDGGVHRRSPSRPARAWDL